MSIKYVLFVTLIYIISVIFRFVKLSCSLNLTLASYSNISDNLTYIEGQDSRIMDTDKNRTNFNTGMQFGRTWLRLLQTGYISNPKSIFRYCFKLKKPTRRRQSAFCSKHYSLDAYGNKFYIALTSSGRMFYRRQGGFGADGRK